MASSPLASASDSAVTRRSPSLSFTIGSRRSALAVAQSKLVIQVLKRSHPQHSFALREIATAGDKNLNVPLHILGARGPNTQAQGAGNKALWTTELEDLLRQGEAALLVHSLKDMPTQLPQGCALGSACNRSERRDCLVLAQRALAQGYTSLKDLPRGSVIGTSSVRRIAQLRRSYPHLQVADVRGNVNTRLRKLDESGSVYTGLILAATGLERLDLNHRITAYLSLQSDDWYSAVGQGALGVEIRSDDAQAQALCKSLMADGENSKPDTGRRTHHECLAERMLLRALEGGCSVPVGVETSWPLSDELLMHAAVFSLDGTEAVLGQHRQRVLSDEDAEAAGLAMAKVLIDQGAARILEAITLNRQIIAASGGA